MPHTNTLIKNINKLHTTPLGIVRIRENLNLKCDNVTKWCQDKLNKSSNQNIKLRGKNYYVSTNDCIITINASSYTIITAHKKASQD